MAIPRTHRIAVYRPGTPSADPYAPSEPAWVLIASDIPANLQPLTGDVQQSAAGRQIDATWRGFVPPQATQHIQEDAVVVVLDGVGPRTFRIRQIGAQGGRWDTEMLLGITAEVVP